MASYYPAGECFFVRSSLQYGEDDELWSAEDAEQFYTHVLVEYAWNGWVEQDDLDHVRGEVKSGQASNYGTWFNQWAEFHVGETVEKDPGSPHAITAMANSLNWNEMRDRDSGGPLKYILRPVPIRKKETKWLWIDATIPIRAIYFPVAQQTDEGYDHYCTYVVMDFKAHKKLTIADLDGDSAEFDITKEWGLGIHTDITWGFNVPDIITYLAIPHQLRNPEYGLYMAGTPGNELFVRGPAYEWDLQEGGDTEVKDKFYRDIDLAAIVSATYGIEVGWRPYQYSSFILNVVTKCVELGLNCVPGVGAILSCAFGMGLELLTDPEEFKSENILELPHSILEAVVEHADKQKVFLAARWVRKLV